MKGIECIVGTEYNVRGLLENIPMSLPPLEVVGLPGPYVFPGPEWMNEPLQLPTPTWPEVYQIEYTARRED